MQQLNALSLRIHQAPSPEQAMELAVQFARNNLHSDRVVLYQLLPDGDGVVIAEALAAGCTSVRAQLIYDPCFLSQWHLHYQQGRSSLMSDVTTSGRADCYLELMARLQVRANLVVPVRSPHPTAPTLWGLLIAHQCHAPRDWQVEEVQYLEFVALQLGVALQAWELRQQALPHAQGAHPPELHGQLQNCQIQLESQIQELKRLNQLKDDFLSTVSHELRNPIASMNLAIQMLERYLQPMGQFGDQAEVLDHYLHLLHSECQREINLINDLMDFTRFDTSTDPLHRMPLPLQFWLPHIAEPFLEQALRQQQHLQIQIPADFPTLMTDSFYLERVVTELLQNACKYTPAGFPIVVTAEVVPPTLETQPPRLLLQVTNFGVGIPAGECDRIFDKFYRIPSHDPWHHGGTGLGLALVKKLTELLQGTIEVSSDTNWTRFALYLPL